MHCQNCFLSYIPRCPQFLPSLNISIIIVNQTREGVIILDFYLDWKIVL